MHKSINMEEGGNISTWMHGRIVRVLVFSRSNEYISDEYLE